MHVATDTREQRQIDGAAARYRASTAQREEVERRREEAGRSIGRDVGRLPVVDEPDQIKARVQRLLETGRVPTEALVATVATAPPTDRHLFLERIIAETNDLQPVGFLTRGARTVRTIARIALAHNGRRVPFGTGFLISPRLLLTNNHVLPDAPTASRSVAEFNCEIDPDGVPGVITAHEFDPDALFLTDERLDYTLVALRPGADGRPAGETFGWNVLMSQQGKIVVGEPINVVGHPMGRLKEIAIRNGELVNQLDDFLTYTTDTQRGNSGSAVFNDQWEVVALHHAGVPSTDDDGNWLKADGTPWHPADGEEAIHWVANEGTRVSVLLRHLEGRAVGEAEAALLAEMTTGVPTPGELADDSPSVDLTAPPSGPTQRAEAGRPARRRTRQARGLAARRAPLGGDTHVVFLHGRSQHGRDPLALRRTWTAGLGEGLLLAGRQPIDARDVWFPFYGDAFIEAVRRRERLPIDPVDGDVVDAVTPTDPSTRRLYEALIDEAAAAAGYPDQVAAEEGLADVVRGLHGKLGWIANRSRLDRFVIALTFRDVAAYLDREQVRTMVLDTVQATMPTSGRLVLISHSLGTVVAMDLLERLPADVDVVQLVTAGSPLGMDTVFDRLLVGGPKRPDRVGGWLNAWCPADPVAIGCPLRDDWGGRVTEVVTDNASDRAHDIAEYLADARVAAAIGDAV